MVQIFFGGEGVSALGGTEEYRSVAKNVWQGQDLSTKDENNKEFSEISDKGGKENDVVRQGDSLYTQIQNKT